MHNRTTPFSTASPPKAGKPVQCVEPKSLETVRREFVEAGVSVADWARKNGFKRAAVVDVLRGRAAGRRGTAHHIAVALGLKAGHVVDAQHFKPARNA